MKISNPFKKITKRALEAIISHKSKYKRHREKIKNDRLSQLAKSCYLPRYEMRGSELIATMKSGTQYTVKQSGWVRRGVK